MRGHIQGPAIATLAGLTYAYVAYSKTVEGQDGTGYGIAGLATAAVVPYTLTVMRGVNRRLMEVAGTGPRVAAGGDELVVRELMVSWGRFNAARGFLPLLGGMVGLWNVMR